MVTLRTFSQSTLLQHVSPIKMQFISKLLPLALVLVHSFVASGNDVVSELDTLIMQLRSASDSESADVLSNVLQASEKYLNNYFGAYYQNMDQSDYFGSASATVNSYGIQGVTGSFICTIQLNAALSFSNDPTPSSSILRNLLTNAFQGVNLDLFIQGLLSVNDPFLSDLTHVIIEIDDSSVTEKYLGSDVDGLSVDNSTEKSLDLEFWARIAIYVTAGVTGMLLMLGAYCLCRCLCRKKKIQDEPDDIKDRTIEFAMSEIGSRPHAKHHNPRGRGPGRKNRTDRSPSPPRSLVSQESSMFTYNPVGMSRDIATLSLGSVSNINGDAQTFDLDAWQRPNVISTVTPAPFGHDISAIEQRDQLSLIEEGNESVSRGRTHSKKKKSSLEVRNPKSRKGSQSTRRPLPQMSDNSAEESNSSSSDVINDLRNLSLQIDKHRRSSSSRNQGK